MKKIYLKPMMEMHSMDVETICLNMSDKPAQKDKLVLAKKTCGKSSHHEKTYIIYYRKREPRPTPRLSLSFFINVWRI